MPASCVVIAVRPALIRPVRHHADCFAVSLKTSRDTPAHLGAFYFTVTAARPESRSSLVWNKRLDQ